MPTQLELIAEAGRRGILPSDKQPLYQEALKRGLISNDQQLPQVDTAEDVTKSVGSNLVGGGLGMAMTLPNLINQAAAGPQLLGRGIAEGVDKLIGVEPQPRGDLWKPFFGSEDVMSASGLDYEPKTTAGKAVTIPAQIAGGLLTARGLQKAEPNFEKLIKGNASGRVNPIQATSSDIAKLSSEKYALAEKQGGTLKPNVTNKFIDDIQSLTRQTAEGKALAGDSPFTKTSEVISSFKDRPLNLQSAQEIDEELSDRIDDLFISQPKQAKKIFDVQTKLRETIDSAGNSDVVGGKSGFDALKEGRRLWAASARLRDVERIISRAEMTENPATAIKTGFKNLASNPSRLRGFSAEEKVLIKRAAKNGIPGDLLGIVGSRLGPIIAMYSGGLGQGVAAQATSMAARSARTKLQVNRATKVANSVANRALNPPPEKMAQNFPSIAAPLSVNLLENQSSNLNRLPLQNRQKLLMRQP